MRESYYRRVLALTPDGLEQFVRDWVGLKVGKYASCHRFSGSGDMGRDVVGFRSSERHDGSWDNYQCKHYGSSISVGVGVVEVAKTLYYAQQGNFTAPAQYLFVAPRGVSRRLEQLIFSPATFRQTVLDDWDKYCRRQIKSNQDTLLTDELIEFIGGWDFSRVGVITLDDMIADDDTSAVLMKWFGADAGDAPKGSVPDEVQSIELPYVAQLVGAYGERDERVYATHADLTQGGQYAEHLALQRERFYDADAFKRFHRDNTDPSIVETVEDDVFHGVADIATATHDDRLSRVNAILQQAAGVGVSGILATHIRVSVKQGLCHHLVNGERLWWSK